MKAALDPQTASKLAKICGLLGSDYEGEQAAAALKATRTLSAAGMTWDDVFAVEAGAAPQQSRPAPPKRPHAIIAAWGLRFPHLLKKWEADFLRDMQRWEVVTPKQQAKLGEVIDRLRKRGAA